MGRHSGPAMTGVVDGIDFDARYTVAGMPGVAFWLHGWDTETTEGGYVLACDDPGCLHDDESCYLWDEPETTERAGYVRAVMVGDDREHVVDVTDLTVIPEDGYCGSCGQTGCRASITT